VAPSGRPTNRSIVEAWMNQAAGLVVQRSVVETPLGRVDHLWISARGDAMALQWSALMRIKREILTLADGDCRTAVEVFPAEPDIRDGADMRHLWVYPLGVDLPFGLHRPEPPGDPARVSEAKRITTSAAHGGLR
jgi:hypothetical protein